MGTIPLRDGRRLFGTDPGTYHAIRPKYPDELYERLRVRCGLGAGLSVFEVGPGTGLATIRLLATGIRSLLAVEPDPHLAAFLASTNSSFALHIVQATFEEVKLPLAAFDMGTAATSFHWLEQSTALNKVLGALKPGGWWAMWWADFSLDDNDAFRVATAQLFEGVPESPSNVGERDSQLSFALDKVRRLDDLRIAGFVDVQVDQWRLAHSFTTAQLVDLYSTFSPVHALKPEQRDRLLRELGRVADRDFGGTVRRPLTYVLYTAQRAWR